MRREETGLARHESWSWLGGLLLCALAGCGGDVEPTFISAPAPPGSRQPELSGGANGLLLSWIEGDASNRSLRYARLSGHRWSETRTIVSDDSDFWDPDTSRKGDPRGAVATALREELDLTVVVLATLVRACA